MARTYRDVLNQIDRLRDEAEALRRKEIAGVVARIQEAIAAYGLTPDDLGFAKAAPKAAKAPGARRRAGARSTKAAAAPAGSPAADSAAKATGKTARKVKGASAGKASRKGGAGRKIPIKYRDTNGNAWSGRGSQPRWLAAALAQGAKLEDFRVTP